ncbi:MAG: hypothetical protein ACFFCW_44640 [Candidatus Hodarchaeota archaeon]
MPKAEGGDVKLYYEVHGEQDDDRTRNRITFGCFVQRLRVKIQLANLRYRG